MSIPAHNLAQSNICQGFHMGHDAFSEEEKLKP